MGLKIIGKKPRERAIKLGAGKKKNGLNIVIAYSFFRFSAFTFDFARDSGHYMVVVHKPKKHRVGK